MLAMKRQAFIEKVKHTVREFELMHAERSRLFPLQYQESMLEKDWWDELARYAREQEFRIDPVAASGPACAAGVPRGRRGRHGG